MVYFLTVRAKDRTFLHRNEKYAVLEDALAVVSARYLADCDTPFRWNGYFSLRSGELTRLYLTQDTAAPLLRDDIERIDIMSERGLLETATWQADAAD